MSAVAFSGRRRLAKWGRQLLLVLVAPWLLTACSRSDGPQRYELSGKVNFGGKPVPFGDIVFEPDPAAGNRGPQGFAKIVDGEYTTEPDRGPVGGPHVVRIQGYPSLPTPTNPQVRALFESFELRAELPKDDATKDFTVPSTGTSSGATANSKRNPWDN